MKALSDKILDKLTERMNETGNSAVRFSLDIVIDDIKNIVAEAEFGEIARDLMKHMANVYHPHHSAIVTSTNAELLEGKQSTGDVTEYLRD